MSTFDGLLSNPPSDLASAPQIVRTVAAYEQQGERFKLQNRAFDKQYAQTYYTRLLALRPHIQRAIQAAWPGMKVSKVLQLVDGEECVLVGTAFKDMKLRYNVLDEYIKDRGLGDLTGHTRFASPDDKIILEDEAARVQLVAEPDVLSPGSVVTGVVLAVRGVPAGDKFHVHAVCYPQLQPQPALPALAADKYIVVISGLGIGDPASSPLRLSLLVEHVGGLLGTALDQHAAAQVVRVIVAGNLVHSNASLASIGVVAGAKAQSLAVGPIHECDMLLARLASLVPVDVMPGQSDPANHSLPQQPLHRCLLPGASRFHSLQRVTNPHQCSLDGVQIMGTSGQNIDDIHRYSELDDRLEMMGLTLKWGHMVPTAPDTLTTYPFVDADPFTITQPPHVYFAGNQPAFATKMLEGGPAGQTRLVAVPSFSASGCAAFVNLRTLDCHPMHFEADC